MINLTNKCIGETLALTSNTLRLAYTKIPKIPEFMLNGLAEEHVRSATVLATAILAEAYQNPPHDLTSTVVSLAVGLGAAELITQGICISSQKVEEYVFKTLREQFPSLEESSNADIKQGFSSMITMPVTFPLMFLRTQVEFIRLTRGGF